MFHELSAFIWRLKNVHVHCGYYMYHSVCLCAIFHKVLTWVTILYFSRYTRNLIDTGNGKFNLMALCWGEGHGSSIHDHADAHCFVKVLSGNLQETMYNWPEESLGETEMHQTECNVYPMNGVAYINGKCDKSLSYALSFYSIPSCAVTIFKHYLHTQISSLASLQTNIWIVWGWKFSRTMNGSYLHSCILLLNIHLFRQNLIVNLFIVRFHGPAPYGKSKPHWRLCVHASLLSTIWLV